MALERVEHVVPQRRLLGRLNLRQIEDDAAALAAEHARDCSRRRARGRRWRPRAPSPSAWPDVPVVEVQAARAEDARREVELRAPVVDDGAAEERPRPRVHLAGDLLGDAMKQVVACEGQLQVALVVERHGVDLPERVLAVEHPAVGAREQRVGDVADALARVGAAASPRGRCPESTGAARSAGIVAAVEPAGPGVAHRDGRPADRRVGRQERDALALALAARAPLDARAHQRAAIGIERRQRRDRLERGGREHVGVPVEEIATNLKAADGAHVGILCTYVQSTKSKVPRS